MQQLLVVVVAVLLQLQVQAKGLMGTNAVLQAHHYIGQLVGGLAVLM